MKIPVFVISAALTISAGMAASETAVVRDPAADALARGVLPNVSAAAWSLETFARAVSFYGPLTVTLVADPSGPAAIKFTCPKEFGCAEVVDAFVGIGGSCEDDEPVTPSITCKGPPPLDPDP